MGIAQQGDGRTAVRAKPVDQIRRMEQQSDASDPRREQESAARKITRSELAVLAIATIGHSALHGPINGPLPWARRIQ